ncbi:hypothetical protein BpHYR1_016356 [Brachionus plicatilis]|uniref:Uncharacterized protein n=1 Tax=Brachionus plicatilis TaxID=10195 RepID=A0A3M7R100_BRAPC|nr:hypothetical protein BpHYR1_016356 [Brachionus plicatilis]
MALNLFFCLGQHSSCLRSVYPENPPLPLWKVLRLFLSDSDIPQHSLPYINVSSTTLLYKLKEEKFIYKMVKQIKN